MTAQIHCICQRGANKVAIIAVALMLAFGASMALSQYAEAATLQTSNLTTQSEAYKAATDAYGNVTISNGKYQYYISNNALYKKRLSTGTVKKVKSLAAGSTYQPYYWSIAATYKGSIFLNMHCMNKGQMKVYRYGIKSGKLTMIMHGCSIGENHGKYVVGNTRFHQDTSPNTYVLYKISNGKLKKVRTLAKYGWGLTVIGKKMYFSQGTNLSMDRHVRLYSSNLKGTGKKLLGGPWKGNGYTWSKNMYGQVLISDVTAKSCKVTKYGSKTNTYIYTYKTKKLKLVSSY